MRVHKVLTSFLVLALVSAGTSFAQQAPASTPVTGVPATGAIETSTTAPTTTGAGTTAPAADPNQKICRTVETLGSRLRNRKICRTAEDWRRTETNSRREVEAVQNRGGSGSSPKMGGG